MRVYTYMIIYKKGKKKKKNSRRESIQYQKLYKYIDNK